MELTQEIFDYARSKKGSFSQKQLQLLGLDIHNLWKGWQKDIIGQDYHSDTIRKFVALKDAHIKKSKNL